MAFLVNEADCLGLVLPLRPEFELSFGVFRALARVIVQIKAESGSRRLVGLGEASIDFPFSPYDAFDVFHALKTAPLLGLQVEDRREALENVARASKSLAGCPAAMCALNEAFDDVEGQVRNVPAVELYGSARPLARCVQSLGIASRHSDLRNQLVLVVATGRTPKPKVGTDLERDCATIATTESLARQIGFGYLLDFNGAYPPDDFASLLELLAQSGNLPRHALAIEQPSSPDCGIPGLADSRDVLRAHGLGAVVVADESFMSAEEALLCASAGIGLNYKIQKLGGILASLAIERSVARSVDLVPPCMVGGTFPTVLGRAYDRVASRVLESATLPADGWLPASAYLDGDRNLAAAVDDGRDRPVIVTDRPRSAGIGVVLDEHRVRRWTVEDFRGLFAAIRGGSSAEPLIGLRGVPYAEVYEQRARRPITWNLPEATA